MPSIVTPLPYPSKVGIRAPRLSTVFSSPKVIVLSCWAMPDGDARFHTVRRSCWEKHVMRSLPLGGFLFFGCSPSCKNCGCNMCCIHQANTGDHSLAMIKENHWKTLTRNIGPDIWRRWPQIRRFVWRPRQ